ncbi:sulfatase-like hydrolase/transferase [Candidatus Nitrosopelagicus sp.]|nr:sulfatase-like hydrolase/transferase [Candidatus Nitrosopelagicus sp.]
MKPNILFLVLDGFRADLCVGKNKTSITPNIDKLVKNGIYFEQAISSGMSSTPSVSSILTSLYPFEALVQDGNLFKINPNIVTYVDELKNRGYYTHAIIQKPLAHIGFKKIFGENLDTYDQTKEKIWSGLGNEIIEKLSRISKRDSWFCYLQLYDLNLLIYPKNEQIEKGPHEINDSKFGKNNYERIISAQDKWIGKIIEKIDLENTLVVFTADHGLESGAFDEELEKFDYEQRQRRIIEPGLSLKMGIQMKTIIPFRKKLASRYKEYVNKTKEKRQEPEKIKLEKLDISNYRKRLMEYTILPKSNIYDDRIRVPLIFCGNGLPREKIVKKLVRSIDIFPTIFDMCNLSNDQLERRGKSLVPSISNLGFTESNVFIESSVNVIKSPDSNVVGIRTSKFKYFRDRNIPEKNVHLFDLKNDPLEENNIASKNQQKVVEFENELKKLNGKLDFAIKKTDEEIGIDEAKDIENKLREAGYIN